MVYASENGVEAMELIRERESDLVILDIRMPEMNGIDMLMRN
jgi:YesN/AraC family two-component response regulator